MGVRILVLVWLYAVCFMRARYKNGHFTYANDSEKGGVRSCDIRICTYYIVWNTVIVTATKNNRSTMARAKLNTKTCVLFIVCGLTMTTAFSSFDVNVFALC